MVNPYDQEVKMFVVTDPNIRLLGSNSVVNLQDFRPSPSLPDSVLALNL